MKNSGTVNNVYTTLEHEIHSNRKVCVVFFKNNINDKKKQKNPTHQTISVGIW